MRGLAIAIGLLAVACDSPAAGPGAAVLVTEPGALITSEMGEGLEFEVVLTSRPDSEVRLPLRAIPVEEGVVEPAELVFSPEDFDQPQHFTVSGADDTADDGLRNLSVILEPLVSADPRYGGIDLEDYELANYDDEIAVTLSDPANADLAPSLLIFEGFVGGDGEAAPQGTAVAVSLSDPPRPGTEVIVRLTLENAEGDASFAADPEALSLDLVFDDSNYAESQVFDIYSFDDNFADDTPGIVLATELVTDDPVYARLRIDPLEVVQVDDDIAGISVSPRASTICEGAIQRIDIALNTVPQGDDVSISFVPDRTGTQIAGQPLVLGDGKLTGSILISSQEDTEVEPDFEVTFAGAATTTDPVYSMEPVGSVTVKILDDDAPSREEGGLEPAALEIACAKILIP